MLNKKFIYNNEILCLFGIMSVLEYMKELSYSKVMLIAPLIFNEKVVNSLGRSTKIRSFEEFRVKHISSISRFNDMYYNFLTLTINTIVILEDMKFIYINDNKIRFNKPLLYKIDEKKIGKRAKKIINIAPKLAKILDEEDEKLYRELGVIL